ncbi:MAG: hypothetical protein ACM3PY_08460 [Omnitrophica WOR_2 bacterium]
MFTRYLEIDPRLDLNLVQRLLDRRGQWSSQPLNYGRVSLFRLADFVSAADKLLSENSCARGTAPGSTTGSTRKVTSCCFASWNSATASIPSPISPGR